MFSSAYEISSKFTFPVICSLRFFDKTVTCQLGTFIILNDEGWIVTVAHLFQPHLAFIQHKQEIQNYNDQLTSINNNTSLNAKQKQKHIAKLKINNKWITNLSYWWGNDKFKLETINIQGEIDLAVGKITNYDSSLISQYPIIKDPKVLRYGTSLCKLGFPFHNPVSAFDEATNSFKLQPGTLPVPRFPIEGIITRDVLAGKTKDDKYDIAFIETSSPGLKGQSGGPIFDTQGTVWAIQSRTQHLPLGFSPKLKIKGTEVEENQFLNVGWGIHPKTLVSFLQDNGVKFQLSSY
ncbi:serine protease [Chloroflexota bacterium]